MNLLDQDILKQMDLNNNEKNNKTKKTVAILLSCIVVVIIVIVIIFFYMAYLESAQLSLTLDGQSNSKVLGLFTAHNDSYYVPIKSLASNLGFSSYNGEYGDKSEETSKCYIQNENEVINFSLNSNVIYKLNTTNTSDNYTYVYLSSPVIAIGGELYISAEDIPNAFNTTYSYDEEENTITMYTMSYLISGWGTAILDYGYTALSEDYENNKAILDNMVVVTDETGEYGVFNLETKSTTLECKYDSVLYQETTGNFIVESDDKYGIIGADKKTKISLNYDSIEMMDYDAELYLVERNGKYGIVNFDGNTILYTEYEEIGIDISDFEYNELKTGYILFDTLIPIKKNDMWGFCNLAGEIIVDFEYDSFGYIVNNNSDTYSVLVIPDYNVVVACLDDDYTLINAQGEKINDNLLVDSVYIIVNNGEVSYKMTSNNRVYDVEEFLESIGISASSKNSSNSTNSTNTTE